MHNVTEPGQRAKDVEIVDFTFKKMNVQFGHNSKDGKVKRLL